jgi:predicted Zn-dependent peptidase
VPSLGHTIDENRKLLTEILEHFKNEKVDADTLARVKTKTRASLIRRLDNNAGLAQLLTSYYVNFGDWRKLFTSLDDIDKVTAEDVQRVARKYFILNTRTEAFNFQPAQAPQTQAASGEKQ